MPDKATTERAKEDLREGKHGVRSPQQAIAIGLSKARRAGIPVPPPGEGRTSASTRKRAKRDYEKGQSGSTKKPSPRRSHAREEVLEREPRSTASRSALSKQTRTASRKRSSTERHDAAMKAVRTKGGQRMKQAAEKAARTRANHRRAA